MGATAKLENRCSRGRRRCDPARTIGDWLGTGIYFWENNPQRALDWAEHLKAHPEVSESAVKHPFVLGAIIDLGNCLDLLESESIRFVNKAYEEMKQLLAAFGSALPLNSGQDPDQVIRRLDCAVINFVHDMRWREKEAAFVSVRAAFLEGKPLYENAGFRSHTHLQICVREERQIMGYFRVRER